MARAQFPTKPNAHTPVREKSDLGSASGQRIWAWPSKTLLRYVREHDICESSNRGSAFLARNSLFRAPYAVWFVAIVVNLRSESESVFVADPQRLCFGMYVSMTSVKAQTVGLSAWQEIHYSGHLTLCGSWPSWSTFVQRAKAYLWLARKDSVSVCTRT